MSSPSRNDVRPWRRRRQLITMAALDDAKGSARPKLLEGLQT
jgi:hypothetical protein